MGGGVGERALRMGWTVSSWGKLGKARCTDGLGTESLSMPANAPG